MNPPVNRGVAVQADNPWKSKFLNYPIVVQDHKEGVYQLYAGPGVVRNGNMLCHYHNAIVEHHGYNVPGKYVRAKTPEYACEIRCRELRLDGYMSADAGNPDCDFVTPPIVHSGKRLELNVDTGASGYVEVELLNVHGRVKWGYRL